MNALMEKIGRWAASFLEEATGKGSSVRLAGLAQIAAGIVHAFIRHDPIVTGTLLGSGLLALGVRTKAGDAILAAVGPEKE